jgi:hypothetical protein
MRLPLGVVAGRAKQESRASFGPTARRGRRDDKGRAGMEVCVDFARISCRGWAAIDRLRKRSLLRVDSGP